MGRPSKFSYEEKMDRRRHHHGHLFETLVTNELHLKRYPMKKQKALKGKVRVIKSQWNFLQYDRLIKTFFKKQYNLTAEELDILLYIAPVNIFTNDQFIDMMKDLGISYTGKRKNLMSKGFIINYSTHKWKVYYTISHKATAMIERMHRMYLLEKEIPMSISKNKVVRNKTPENEALTELFESFNEKVRENKGG